MVRGGQAGDCERVKEVFAGDGAGAVGHGGGVALVGTGVRVLGTCCTSLRGATFRSGNEDIGGASVKVEGECLWGLVADGAWAVVLDVFALLDLVGQGFFRLPLGEGGARIAGENTGRVVFVKGAVERCQDSSGVSLAIGASKKLAVWK